MQFQTFQAVLPVLNVMTMLSTIPTMIFFGFFLRDYLKTKQQIFACLVVTFGFYLVQHFATAQQGLFDNQANAELFFIITRIFNLLTLYCLLMVLELFERNTPFSGRITILTMIMAAMLGAIATNPEVISEKVGDFWFVRFPFDGSIRIIQVIFGVVSISWFFTVLIRSYRRAKAPKQKHLIILIVAGLLFYEFLGSVIPVGMEQIATHPDEYIIFLIGTIEFSGNIGMFLIGYAFYRASKEPWLLQRQKVHLLLVYSKDGLDLFSKIFSDEIAPDDVTLLTGGFTAVSSMFQEVTKSQAKVQAIQFEGRILRLINRELFITALLVDYTTKASELALQKFSEEFDQKFADQLRKFAGNVSVFESASTIAEKYFS